MRTGGFQTLYLCENPPHVLTNNNFILTLIQCVLAFKYRIPLKLRLFYSAFSTLSIHGPTFSGFLSPSFTTCVDIASARLASSSASDNECACMREGKNFPQCPSSTSSTLKLPEPRTMIMHPEILDRLNQLEMVPGCFRKPVPTPPPNPPNSPPPPSV